MSTTLAPRLVACVDALRDDRPTPDARDAAQRRLVERLERAGTMPRPRALRLVGAAVAACAVAVLALGPLFLGREALAFADVQRHFLAFETLEMTIETSAGGAAMPRQVVQTTRDGRVRVDIGSNLSVILDTARGHGISLLHDARAAAPFAFPPGGRAPRSDGEVDWLEELRTFQGMAERIAETRTIDGQLAYGFALTLAGQRTELWANADGLPLAMEIDAGGGATLALAFEFAFNRPIDPALFSTEAPPGYARADGE